jgi:hypothetical protein
MDQNLFKYLYIGLMILVIACCVGLIMYLSKQTNACIGNPIGFFMDYMNKTGANCLCGEGIKTN